MSDAEFDRWWANRLKQARKIIRGIDQGRWPTDWPRKAPRRLMDGERHAPAGSYTDPPQIYPEEQNG